MRVVDFTQLQVLLLVFARMTAFMAVAPFFSFRNVPPLVKAGLGVLLTLLVFPVLKTAGYAPSGNLLAYVLAIAGEVLVGLALGFGATLVFTAIRMSGELIDLEMGFAMTGLLDPLTGSRINLIGQYMYLLGILVFLTIDGHHYLIRTMVDSYQLLPLGGASYSGAVMGQITRMFSGMFALSLRIVAPVLAVLFISDAALGMVSRTVPQLNVFMLGFPLKVGLGLISVSLIAPLFATVVQVVFSQMGRDLVLLMESLK